MSNDMSRRLYEIAYESENVTLIKLLMEGETNINTLIKHAVSECDTELVNKLLDLGADPNIKYECGNTLIDLAVALVDIPTIKLLIKNKAQINTGLLTMAIVSSDARIIKILLDAGVVVTTKHIEMADQFGTGDVVEMLRCADIHDIADPSSSEVLTTLKALTF